MKNTIWGLKFFTIVQEHAELVFTWAEEQESATTENFVLLFDSSFRDCLHTQLLESLRCLK